MLQVRASWLRSAAVLLALAIALILSPGGRLLAEESPLTDEERALFAWLDSIGVPDVKGRPYVRVAIGRPFSHCEAKEPTNTFVNGFLLAEEGDAFTILAPDLTTQTCYRRTTGPDTPASECVAFEPLHVPSEAVSRVLEMRDAGLDVGPWEIPPRLELVGLARGCAANGHEKLAHELCKTAATLPDRTLSPAGVSPPSMRGVRPTDFRPSSPPRSSRHPHPTRDADVPAGRVRCFDPRAVLQFAIYGVLRAAGGAAEEGRNARRRRLG